MALSEADIFEAIHCPSPGTIAAAAAALRAFPLRVQDEIQRYRINFDTGSILINYQEMRAILDALYEHQPVGFHEVASDLLTTGKATLCGCKILLWKIAR